jgi:hypothetical protein
VKLLQEASLMHFAQYTLSPNHFFRGRIHG